MLTPIRRLEPKANTIGPSQFGRFRSHSQVPKFPRFEPKLPKFPSNTLSFNKPRNRSDESRRPIVATTSCSEPPRLIATFTLWSGAISETSRFRRRTLVTFSLSIRRMTSSLRSPAFSAGLSLTMRVMATPRTWFKL